MEKWFMETVKVIFLQCCFFIHTQLPGNHCLCISKKCHDGTYCWEIFLNEEAFINLVFIHESGVHVAQRDLPLIQYV